ncbi:MAG: 50S ribosomal protein L21 [Actinomycetota bacterium]|nr:50S ribosomal protein L21 [Actinomycetota bacterium]
MYAVIQTGGKQYRVAEGEQLQVELLGQEADAELSLTPVMVVDGDTVLSTAEQLAGATVTARIVGQTKGPKVTGFRYKNKSNQRKRWGHRQKYDMIEITGISRG